MSTATAQKGRRRERAAFGKGRQVTDQAIADVQHLLGDQPRRREYLIEYLHLIQDAFGHLSDAHMAALAAQLRLAQTEV